MPDDTSTPKATGRDIIEAITGNMGESLEPLAYTVIAPSRYDVYLNETDYDRLSGILPRIVDEAKRALTQAQQVLQSDQRSWKRFLSGPPLPVKPAEPDWFIRFHVGDSREVSPGSILVHSSLSMPTKGALGPGSETRRIVTQTTGGRTRRLRTSTESTPSGDAAPLARLTYRDPAGRPREYLMLKSEILVGRGGQDVVPDLAIEGPHDVSRRHFYLRRSEAKEYLLQDVSSFGTAVDGETVPPKVWTPIARRATFVLANKVTVEFEAL